MLQAMLAGVASIKAQQTRMNVIGNNLANVNTTAYKGSRVTFQDMLAQTVRGASRPTGGLGGTNAIQFGLGVLVAGTDINTEQGSLNATNRPTDFAIQGNGFFLVSNGERLAYTRDGSFDLDANGDIVHRATGERLMGWPADPATGNINTNAPISPASNLTVPIGARTAVQVTTNVTYAGNLDSREFSNAGLASTQSIVRVFDSLGGSHDLTLTLTESATPNQWDWTVAGAGGTTVTGSGSLTFDPANGAMLTGSPGTITVTPPAAGGVPAFSVDLDFGGISQLATEMQVQASSQNGFEPGSLSSFSVNTDGIIVGLYTNGLTRSLGQIASAIFPNPNGLERQGSNLWRNTDNSGVPVVGAPRSGGRGQINAGFLEQSNIDIGNEFTDLIITQRGFQANTRVVTTVDEMLQDLINMKR
ncbi:MAG: flagellar hook protein FlgE [Armatimonadetes bacterium]|nr:flagellar hook protein FlgE [Armatimonadota bacterium]MBS1711976.1 flagellar hook protein FlgE [Armatimonadota bacterium]MBX3109470.1 flagellar hook protein FlgE [Fimbriimonadaceae bacterium]